MLTRPAVDRVMPGPEALTTGKRPKSVHFMAPSPSSKLSLPRIDTPCIRAAARQIIPRSQEMTCSAENGYHRPFNLISPGDSVKEIAPRRFRKACDLHGLEVTSA